MSESESKESARRAYIQKIKGDLKTTHSCRLREVWEGPTTRWSVGMQGYGGSNITDIFLINNKFVVAINEKPDAIIWPVTQVYRMIHQSNSVKDTKPSEGESQ